MRRLVIVAFALAALYGLAHGPAVQAGETPTPTPSGALHTIHGTAYESQSGYLRGATVTLLPTKRTAMTSLQDGSFSFADVADGAYDLTIVPVCTPFGCYTSQHVVVDGEDAFVKFHPAPPPTLTPTPSPVPAPGEDEALFTNASTHAASGLHVRGMPYFGSVSVYEQPDGCPDPVIFLGASDATLSWGVACVRPGDSVTVHATADCPVCDVAILEPGEWLYDALGNVDCTGGADALDALLILQRVAELITALLCFQNADVDGDGEITAMDATLVLQFDAGLLPSLGPRPVLLRLLDAVLL